MDLIKVKSNYQITLPPSLCKRFQVAKGDYMKVEDNDFGISIKPLKIPIDQEYFYTRQWQNGEAEADRDIAEGNIIGTFDNIETALDALKNTEI